MMQVAGRPISCKPSLLTLFDGHTTCGCLPRPSAIGNSCRRARFSANDVGYSSNNEYPGTMPFGLSMFNTIATPRATPPTTLWGSGTVEPAQTKWHGTHG